MPQMTRNTERVLAEFLRDPTKPRYGLEISKGGGLSRRTIYPILARLEAAGWIASEWEQIDPSVERRPARRYYKLTAEGERVAHAAVYETQAHLRGLRPIRPDWGKT